MSHKPTRQPQQPRDTTPYYGSDRDSGDLSLPPAATPVAPSSHTRMLIPTLDAGHYSKMLEAQDLSPDEKSWTQRNFELDACKEVINAGAHKNLCVIISRPVDARVTKYLDILGSCIDELPMELMWRARSPIIVDVAHIAQRHIGGYADIRGSQYGIRIGVTQALADIQDIQHVMNPSNFDGVSDAHTEAALFSREQINATLVHEIIHKLSTQHDSEGQLLMPRSDWLAAMRANGIETLVVLSDQQKQDIEKNYSMIIRPTPINELPEDQDEFLAALRRTWHHPLFYPTNILEVIAFSAQNKDLSDGKTPEHLHNPLHDLTATRSILRRGLLRTSVTPGTKQEHGYEFDGVKWQKFTLECDDGNARRTIAIEPCTQKTLSFEKYLHEQLQSRDQLQDADFVKRVVAEANRRAHGEVRFAWARLSARDQEDVMKMTKTESIDLPALTHEWIVQSALFTHMVKLYGFDTCETMNYNAPQGFIAMTKGGSIVMGSAPDTYGERDFTYYRLAARGTGGIPTTTHGALAYDARTGERLQIPRVTTSKVRHLVSFEPRRTRDARHMTDMAMQSFVGIKNLR